MSGLTHQHQRRLIDRLGPRAPFDDAWEGEFRKQGIDPHGFPLYLARQLLSFASAGRNLNNLAHRISHSERRPVLVAHNPRCAAFLQLGSRHWLASLGSRSNANEFVSALHTRPTFNADWMLLQERISTLKSHLHSSFGSTLTISVLEKDPSADIRLETLSAVSVSPSSVVRGLKINVDNVPENVRAAVRHSCYIKYFHCGNQTPIRLDEADAISAEEFCEKLKSLEEHLLKIATVKDNLRSQIFALGYDWLSAGRIPSFVYPINHFKLSGNGHWARELSICGEAKLLKTVSFDPTLFIFADVHGGLPEVGEDKGGNIISRDELKKCPGEFAELLRNSASLVSTLHYPGNGHSILASKAKEERLKLLDLQAALPWQYLDDYSQRLAPEDRFDPSVIMQPGNVWENMRELGQEILLPRRGPRWIHDFEKDLPIEPNYTPWGIEFLSDRPTEL